jgi:hypothetical protein
MVWSYQEEDPRVCSFCYEDHLGQETNHPLTKSGLIEHKFVNPQWKEYPGIVIESYALSEEEEEIEEVAPRRLIMKNPSNAFVPSSSKEEAKFKMKKLTWWQRNILCMNVDINKKLHDIYVP